MITTRASTRITALHRHPGRARRCRRPRPLVRARSRPRRSRASATAASPTPTPPWRRTTRRSTPSPRFAAQGGQRHRHGRRGAHRERRAGPRQGTARRRAQGLRAGDDLLAAVRAAVEQFVDVFTNMGGLMAERVTDLRDIERRLVAHLVGEPEPGVPTPDRAVGPGGRGPRAGRHRRPRPGRRRRPGHRAGRPDQPHRDHRPPARHPLRGGCRRGDATSPAGTRSSSTAAGTVEIGADPTRPRGRVAETAGARGARRPGPVPPPPPTARRSSCSPTSPTASPPVPRR